MARHVRWRDDFRKPTKSLGYWSMAEGCGIIIAIVLVLLISAVYHYFAFAAYQQRFPHADAWTYFFQ